jgi:hypothetical protein
MRYACQFLATKVYSPKDENGQIRAAVFSSYFVWELVNER